VKPYYQDEAAGITIYCGDCREILPTLPKVDLVLTDPPYGMRKAAWDGEFPEAWYGLVNARMVVVITGSSGLSDSIRLVGPDFIDVIAARNLNGMTRGPLGFGNWLAAVVAKGKPRQGINCFDFSVSGDMPAHPSPKPLVYMVRMVERLSGECETVLDPFMGSGTTLVACKRLGRRGIGIEIEEKYCEIAAQRLERERLTLFESVSEQLGLMELVK
jgi:predicted RNA methylase